MLDIDPRNGGAESLQMLIAQYGPLPETPTVSTGGGGQHLYLRVNTVTQSKSGLWRGIDVKAEGGYVVAPPSIHASGCYYAWVQGRALDDVPLAEAPVWLTAAIAKGAAGSVLSKNGNHVRVGDRNNRLTSVAGGLRRNGGEETEIRDALRIANAATCDPPLPTTEVDRIAASVSRYPVGDTSNVAELLKATGVAHLTKDSPLEERDAALRRLKSAAATFDELSRALLRTALVDLGFGALVADSVVRKGVAEGSTNQGQAILFDDGQPWPEPVDTSELLRELLTVITSHVVLAEREAVAMALWVLHTHALDAAHITPRLAIVSPEKRCGKSTVLKLLASLVRRPLSATNITASSLFRTIEAHHPTLLVDEVDTFLRDRDDVRGVLNAGHDRDAAKVPRCVGDDHEPRVFNVWAPVAFAGIGRQHDTLMDRSIVISMKRRARGERVTPLRRRERQSLGELRRKCVRWSKDVAERLAAIEVDAIPALDDRASDNWEALLAVAELAERAWRDLARAAALGLSGEDRGEQSDTLGESLLTDVREIFEAADVQYLSAKSLLARLLALEGRPWAEAVRGKPLTPNQLGRRLGSFGVHSQTVREGKVTERSYVRSDFEDAFSRYLPVRTVATVTSAEAKDFPPDPKASQPPTVTDDFGGGSPSVFTTVADVTGVGHAEQGYVAEERAAIQEFGS